MVRSEGQRFQTLCTLTINNPATKKRRPFKYVIAGILVAQISKFKYSVILITINVGPIILASNLDVFSFFTLF